MYEFEQEVRQEMEDETCSSSKKVGNCFSNLVSKKGGECISIGEGVSSESIIDSETTNDPQTPRSKPKTKEAYSATPKSKFLKARSPTSPEVRIRDTN